MGLKKGSGCPAGRLTPAGCALRAAQGQWRTPHPDPSPTAPYVGLSGAVPVSMTYMADGTLLFMERPHGPYQSGQQNPLLVNVRAPPVPLPGWGENPNPTDGQRCCGGCLDRPTVSVL